jgi:hypothetical protein
MVIFFTSASASFTAFSRSLSSAARLSLSIFRAAQAEVLPDPQQHLFVFLERVRQLAVLHRQQV